MAAARAKFRVLFIGDSLTHYMGGVDRHVLGLCNAPIVREQTQRNAGGVDLQVTQPNTCVDSTAATHATTAAVNSKGAAAITDNTTTEAGCRTHHNTTTDTGARSTNRAPTSNSGMSDTPAAAGDSLDVHIGCVTQGGASLARLLSNRKVQHAMASCTIGGTLWQVAG